MINQISKNSRPTKFADVVEQNVIVRILQNRLRDGNIHHAYIFSGKHGVAKTTLCRIFARALNCKNFPVPEPCGECEACLDKSSRDIIEFDAASHTGVDDIRETILASINNYPIRDRYRIFILDEAHMLSPSAFNALLKTLEEPPEYLVFMLATTEPYKLPKTIRSRCQIFELKEISMKGIEANLKAICAANNIEIDDRSIYKLGLNSNGSLRDAQSFLETVISYAGNSKINLKETEAALGLVNSLTIFEILKWVNLQNLEELSHMTSYAESAGTNLVKLVEELALTFRDLLVYKVSPHSLQLKRDHSELHEIKYFSECFSEFTCIRLAELTMNTAKHMRHSINIKFETDMLFAKICAINKLPNLEEAIEKVNELYSTYKPN